MTSTVTPPPKYNFTGKVALVTGSSSGIGAAIATKLAQYGAHLTITGRNRENLTKVGKKIEAVSGGHVPLQLIGDLLDPATGEMLVKETIAKYGRLDILVNNAGGASAHGDLLKGGTQLLKDFDAVHKLNVRAPVQLIQLAMPHLVKTKGNVLNIVSVDGITPSQLDYSSSKAALIMVTKTCAMDLGPQGVRVNAIAPGPVNTAFGRSYGEPNVYKEHAEEFKKGTVLHRIAEPEEIASLACFLTSEDACNVTGSIMVDDGGVLVVRR